MWIKRDISSKIRNSTDLIQVLIGPRQVGKSSLFLSLDPSFKEISFDDLSVREFAQNNPELFLKQFANQKIFIDEAQYAPNIFPALKRQADLLKRNEASRSIPFVRLSGSNQILLDRQIKESLAGRAAYFELNTLSVHEILSYNNYSIIDILYRGGWPELYADSLKSEKSFLDNYIASYIEKDIILTAGIQKQYEFLKFLKLLAGRVGQLVDYSYFANEVGVDSKTIKEWLSVLERMKIIGLVRPFSSNLTSRLVKSPRVFFVDTGLACRLQGWTSSDPLMTSPNLGFLFENLVYSELYKTSLNFTTDIEIFHWRSKDQEEIDFLLQLSNQKWLFVEVKLRPQKTRDLNRYPEVKKVFKTTPPPVVTCHMESESLLPDCVAIKDLASYLQTI